MKKKTSQVKSALSFMEEVKEDDPKKEFMEQFGIEMGMPANYIYESLFFKNRSATGVQGEKTTGDYLVTVSCQVYPTNITFYDFGKLNSKEDPLDHNFAKEAKDQSGKLQFKVYKLEDNRYKEIHRRTIEDSYLPKLVFSDDRRGLAIFKKDRNLKQSILSGKVPLEIDIFDCSSLDFFLRADVLTQRDESLLHTISGRQLGNFLDLDKNFFRFSQEREYLQVTQERKHILIYQLVKSAKAITQPVVDETLPSYFECILNLSIDEIELGKSMIAAKKSDFRNVEFFPLQLIQEVNQRTAEDGQNNLNSYEMQAIIQKYPINSIRLTEYNLESINLRFSLDHSQVVYCDNNQHVLLELSQSLEEKQHQRTIHHLNMKTCRMIARYGDSDFFIVTANSSDNEISIRHSSDPSIKIKFYFRFSEGTCHIRDLVSDEDDQKLSIIVTRDDEEFIVYEWNGFKEQPVFWQRFYEISNYIFEWPYLCYLQGQKIIVIQNAFKPDLAFFYELSDIEEDETISNLFLSDQYLLYIVIQTKSHYHIYEKGLDACMKILFPVNKIYSGVNYENSSTTNQGITKTLTNFKKQNVPVASILKSYINYKSIYKFFIRSPSDREIVQMNNERVIFFLCDFKIYSINEKGVHKVDTGYKFRTINQNLIAFNTVDSKGKKANEVKYIQIGTSDYIVTKVYEEFEGKLVEFLVQEGQLLILSKIETTERHQIKIFEVNQQFQPKLKFSLYIDDQKLIGSLQTVDYFQNNMIPAGNDLYNIVNYEGQAYIHYFQNVISLKKNTGSLITFASPLLNITYRKMVYFVTNKDFQKPKSALIIPLLTDNFIMFNKRDNITQHCIFREFREQRANFTRHKDILCLAPYIEVMLQYNQKGQLIEIIKLKNIYTTYGELNLAISQGGQILLQSHEEQSKKKPLTLLQIGVREEKVEAQDTSPFQSPGSNKIQDTFMEPGIPKAFIDVIEQIDLNTIEIKNQEYQDLQIKTIDQLVQFFKKQGCEVVYKVNDNVDILIGFLYSERAQKKSIAKKYLKELVLLKKASINGKQRESFFIRPEKEESQSAERIKIKSLGNPFDRLTSNRDRLLGDIDQISNQQYEMFINMNKLLKCNDFLLTDEKIVIWSNQRLYSQNLDRQAGVFNSNEETLTLKLAKFQIPFLDEAYIANINANGQNQEDKDLGNFYVYIKINFDSFSTFLKYNINKNKEFSSFDCSQESMIFFDSKQEGYILDSNSIIDIDQGIPLYYYKTGVQQINKHYLPQGTLDRGGRFCSENLLFMVRNRLYIPYSFFSFIMIENNVGKGFTQETYDPDGFFCLKGQTVLHSQANNFKNLEFLLNNYVKTNPKLLNMILLKNAEGNNVLQIALQRQNSKCVNLILEKMSKISMNNIHAFKANFVDLLNYNGFEEYLKLCFFQTEQMTSKQIFQRKQKSPDDTFLIEPNETSILDSQFQLKFHDPNASQRQVTIRGLDAGWILKDINYGIPFLTALSSSDNMNYFTIDTIKLIVNYQWQQMKSKIIFFLFLPFIFNMCLYNFYCIYTYEMSKSNASDSNQDFWGPINNIVQALILIFTIQTFYVEIKQIQYHQNEYIESFWNVLDLSTVILAPLTVLLDILQVDGIYIRPWMALCNLIFYLRFFYFLRIFDSSAPLIRTIIEITTDIRHFLLVFLIGVLGVGASFQIIVNNNIGYDGGSQFIASFPGAFIYSYRMTLGDFDLGDFDTSRNSTILWLLFMVSSMFTAIVLLNMLVAIMGDSFSRVTQQAENQRVREHLQLIVENDFLIDRQSLYGKVKFLIEIRDDSQDMNQDQIENLYTKIENLIQVRDLDLKKDIKNVVSSLTYENSILKKELLNMKDIFRKEFLKMQTSSETLENKVTYQSNHTERMQSVRETLGKSTVSELNE